MMRFNSVFKNLGTKIYLVTKEQGDLDLDTGIRPIYYQYERTLALIGITNVGLQLHFNLNESSIVLSKKASLVVIDDQVFKLTLQSSSFGLFIYTKDKVEGNEFKLILDGVPKASSD